LSNSSGGPGRFGEFFRLLHASGFRKHLRFHYIVLQSAPQFNAEKQCVEICYHCPDATIRNGKLAPVCLADWIAPPGKREGEEPGDAVLARTIYGHLEEV
jgi:hypothetical protein